MRSSFGLGWGARPGVFRKLSRWLFCSWGHGVCPVGCISTLHLFSRPPVSTCASFPRYPGPQQPRGQWQGSVTGRRGEKRELWGGLDVSALPEPAELYPGKFSLLEFSWKEVSVPRLWAPLAHPTIAWCCSRLCTVLRGDAQPLGTLSSWGASYTRAPHNPRRSQVRRRARLCWSLQVWLCVRGESRPWTPWIPPWRLPLPPGAQAQHRGLLASSRACRVCLPSWNPQRCFSGFLFAFLCSLVGVGHTSELLSLPRPWVWGGRASSEDSAQWEDGDSSARSGLALACFGPDTAPPWQIYK